MCWTLLGPARRRNAGRARHGAAGLTVAVTIVVALAASGCANTAPAPADAAYGVHIEHQHAPGAARQADHGHAQLRLADRHRRGPHHGCPGSRSTASPPPWATCGGTVRSPSRGIDIGAGSATLHVLTSYGVGTGHRAAHQRRRHGRSVRGDRCSRRRSRQWSDIDAELTKSGARYSYQVSKVVPEGPAGKCVGDGGHATPICRCRWRRSSNSMCCLRLRMRSRPGR